MVKKKTRRCGRITHGDRRRERARGTALWKGHGLTAVAPRLTNKDCGVCIVFDIRRFAAARRQPDLKRITGRCVVSFDHPVPSSILVCVCVCFLTLTTFYARVLIFMQQPWTCPAIQKAQCLNAAETCLL